MSQPIIIGSRGSDLALWQANYTKRQLEAQGYTVSIQIIKTQGDRIQHLSFDKMEGKGFFTKELEEALLAGTIDLAVHSYKDLPSIQPPGLLIAGISDRAHPSDVLLVRDEVADPTALWQLPEGAVVGTSSARRKSQLLLFRPDVKLKDIRGNVPTRINKLREGQFDAILMAKAGLDRIEPDISGLQRHVFDPTQFVPAPAQGVLAFQIREKDEAMATAIAQITDKATAAVNYIERETLKILEGGCQIPLGIYARQEEGAYHVWCSYSESWDGIPHRVHFSASQAAALPQQVLQNIRQKINHRLFISRPQSSDSLFSRLMEHRGAQVTGASLVDFAPVALDQLPPASIYCFSSRNAVRFLHQQHPQPPAGQLWALGEGTAQALREVGWHPTVVGNGDAATMAQHLAEAKPDKVVFPLAKSSRASIQAALPGEMDYENVVVYDNMPKTGIHLPEVDIAVLTSPMNAAVFCSQYSYPMPKLVAIGRPTKEALEEMTTAPVKMAYAPTEWALADTVSAMV